MRKPLVFNKYWILICLVIVFNIFVFRFASRELEVYVVRSVVEKNALINNY